MRKRVSFDETPVEISREPSGSKLNQNGLVPNGIHLNHHTMGQKYKNVFSTILKIWYVYIKKNCFKSFKFEFISISKIESWGWPRRNF